MKKKNMLIVSMAMAAICTAGMVRAEAPAGQEHRGPRIEISKDRVDLGIMKQGEEATQVFEIRNAGDEVLLIQKVQTS